MKLLMAVSKDGYVARHDHDDMRWLGESDKALFRVLTATGGRCWIGRRSASSMPQVLDGRSDEEHIKSPRPHLFGRTIKVLGTGEGATRIEHLRYKSYDQDWLLGGQELALKALALDLSDVLPCEKGHFRSLIDEIHLCRSERWAFPESRQFFDRITPLLNHFGPNEPAIRTKFGDTVHELWRIDRPIPCKIVN